jgi:outer membrane protein
LNLTQSVVNYGNWLELCRAQSSVKAAHATLYAAEQALFVRVATQYFAILRAEDAVTAATAKLAAFNKQLEQTQVRYKVGLIAVTDVEEARAGRDTANAALIAANNDYQTQIDLLRQIIGASVTKVQPLKAGLAELQLHAPVPEQIDAWVTSALANNFTVNAAKFNVEVAKQKMQKTSAGHLPTLNLEGGVTNSKNTPGTDPARVVSKNIGLKLSVPLFQGGQVLSQSRQAAYEYQGKKEEYHQALRVAETSTRQAYNGVFTQISRVKALKQAVVSSQSALKATTAAFDAGTRTVVDVLNSETNLLDAERDYAAARYDYLLQHLQLKGAIGALVVDDLNNINAMFAVDKN